MTTSVKAPCNQCQYPTRHNVLYEKELMHHEDEGVVHCLWGKEKYELLQCRGCEGISLRVSEWSSDNLAEGRRLEPMVKYYPPRIARREPPWSLNLLFEAYTIYDLLRETYVALQNNCPRLAAMAARSVLDHVMTDKLGDIGGFEQKLSHFEPEYVSRKQRQMLERVLNVGDAAIHRSYEPKPQDLDSMMNIVEGLIQQIYVDADAAARLKAPPRSREKQSTKKG